MRVKLDAGALAPTRAHDTDAGLDIYAAEKAVIPPHSYAVVRTGTHIELPKGCAGLLVSKSGLCSKHGITTTGLIDETYSGEILVTMFNNSDREKYIRPWDKITQLVVIPVRYEAVEIADELPCVGRGENGFGSTGR